jgi:hypothetical protein
VKPPFFDLGIGVRLKNRHQAEDPFFAGSNLVKISGIHGGIADGRECFLPNTGGYRNGCGEVITLGFCAAVGFAERILAYCAVGVGDGRRIIYLCHVSLPIWRIMGVTGVYCCKCGKMWRKQEVTSFQLKPKKMLIEPPSHSEAARRHRPKGDFAQYIEKRYREFIIGGGQKGKHLCAHLCRFW